MLLQPFPNQAHFNEKIMKGIWISFSDRPRKGWFTLLRLYGPLEPWFDKTWRPGEIEEVK